MHCVTLTDAHSNQLRKHIHIAAFRVADVEDDQLYDPELVLSLRGKSRKRMSLREVGTSLATAGEGAAKKRKPSTYDETDSGGEPKDIPKEPVTGKRKAQGQYGGCKEGHAQISRPRNDDDGDQASVHDDE